MSTTRSLLFVVLVLSGSASLVPQAPIAPDLPHVTGQVLEDLVATQNFQRSVAEYVVLHQMLEHEAPPVLVTPDIGQIQRAVRALQMRIQVAGARRDRETSSHPKWRGCSSAGSRPA